MSPVIRECERLEHNHFILHTGQHYSYNMDKVFFRQLDLPEAKFNLDVGSGSHAEQTGRMLMGIEEVLMDETPDLVLVEGDTNSVLAGALAACKLGVQVGHVEAGLRSYDRGMPEEVNRVLTDHCSDYLFPPTEKSRSILLGEGLSESKIFVTGNTIVDAVYQNIELAEREYGVLSKYGLAGKEYFLATVHRQENVDDCNRFSSILKGLDLVGEHFGFPVIYPIHPRARKMMQKFGLDPGGVRLIDTVDYLSFLKLEKEARLVFTDSGGVQEETCIIGVPCVTLRNNTERPETLEVGSNILVGTESDDILKGVEKIMGRSGWDNPFGDGDAGKKIVEILQRHLG